MTEESNDHQFFHSDHITKRATEYLGKGESPECRADYNAKFGSG